MVLCCFANSHDYDLLEKSMITDQVYNGGLKGDIFDPNVNETWWRYYGPSKIDDELIFTVLQNETWTYINGNSYTNRDMHSILDWGISYDRGTFFEYGYVDTICSENNLNTGDQGINHEWFPQDTNATMRRLVDKDYNDNDEFLDDTFRLLQRKNSVDFVRLWAEMNCEYLHIDSKCVLPKYFDDCSDDMMEYKGGFYDINITLNGLIDKVEGYECMIATRKRMYEWAKQTGTLWKLCRGDYDLYCDKTMNHDGGWSGIIDNDCSDCDCNDNSNSNNAINDKLEIDQSEIRFVLNANKARLHHYESFLFQHMAITLFVLKYMTY